MTAQGGAQADLAITAGGGILSGRPGRWGALQGGLGIIIVASAAVGAAATMVTRSVPGVVLGLVVVVGAIAAALAVLTNRRLILPVPVAPSVAVPDRRDLQPVADSSKTALAIGAAQSIANQLLAMAFATVLAAAIIAVRWYLWRRNRPATRGPDWPARAERTVRGAAGCDLGDLSGTRIPRGLRAPART